VRWGFGDAVWVLVVGVVGSSIVGAITVAVRHADLSHRHQSVHFDAIDTAITTVVQYALMLGLTFLLIGWKGRGVRHDLGLVVRATDWWWLSIGVGGSIAVGIALFPISHLWSNGHHGSQEIGKQLQDSASWSRVVLFVLIVCVAPVAEELLFRGIVLRAALRRMHAPGAVLVSGASFAALHLLDPTTFPALPALFALGTFSAVVAIRSGSLSRSILLHSGFNLLGAIQLLAASHR
jgi:membrane protease YdiL (CAAX protease family)